MIADAAGRAVTFVLEPGQAHQLLPAVACRAAGQGSGGSDLGDTICPAAHGTSGRRRQTACPACAMRCRRSPERHPACPPAGPPRAPAPSTPRRRPTLGRRWNAAGDRGPTALAEPPSAHALRSPWPSGRRTWRSSQARCVLQRSTTRNGESHASRSRVRLCTFDIATLNHVASRRAEET